jgi:signal transduction histidine kinase/CheY-like chemotaxis protein
MNISSIRSNLYQSKIQIIQLDPTSQVLESDNTIFVIKENTSIGSIHPFFEGITPIIMGTTTKVNFPCVNLNIDSKNSIVDIEIIKKDEKLFLIIFDFTEHYTDSHPLVQEKNEASISKSKLAFERNLLLAKEDFKNKFLAHINHEIRNPLNSILGFLEILKNTKLDYEQKETLNVLQKTSLHLKVLMDDLVDISKIEKGYTDIKNIPFNLGQLLINLSKHFQIKYAETGIELELNIDKSTPQKLIGDPTRVNQIIFNLLENAFKHTKKGKITLSTSANENNDEETKIKFIISDTGAGIPKKEIDKIFKSYYQIELNEIKPIGEGLGLKIVKELTTLLNGQINVTSEKGKGTVYEITLPFKVRTNKNKKKKSVPKGSGILLSKRILIVEDEEINQMLLMKTFLDNEKGFFIEIARDGKHALSLLENRKYDLILLKMKLPDFNGVKILEFVKNSTNPKLKKTPVLVASGGTMKNEQEKIIKSGADGFLPKPYTKKELFSKIESLLK